MSIEDSDLERWMREQIFPRGRFTYRGKPIGDRNVILPTEKNDRKERPIARGVLDYFPDAIAEVARVSLIGNQQHNPGETMHWTREKSTDHADCIARHLIERGKIDTDGLQHTAKIAWRALAMLQEEIERFPLSFQCPVSAPEPEPTNREFYSYFPPRRVCSTTDHQELMALGCDPVVSFNIACGTTHPVKGSNPDDKWIYLAGPMRGLAEFNFPAFDAIRDQWVRWGFTVISPADIDRAGGIGDVNDPKPFVYRDLFALLLVASRKGSIVMLPEWEKSTGATAEFFLARWLGLRIRDAETGNLLRYCDVNYLRVLEVLSKSLPGDV